MSLTCGEEHVEKHVMYENEKGEKNEIPVFEMVGNIENDTNNAVLNPLAFVAPELGDYVTGAEMKRLDRNLTSLRDMIYKICDETRAKHSKEELEQMGSLMSILLTDDLYKNNQYSIANEVITFFLAGTQTVALSTANALMYLNQNKHKEYKKKFLDEVEHLMEGKKDVFEDFTLEDCDNLRFVK